MPTQSTAQSMPRPTSSSKAQAQAPTRTSGASANPQKPAKPVTFTDFASI